MSIEKKYNDRVSYFSFLQNKKDKTGRMTNEAIMGSQSISNTAPAKAKR